MECKATLLLGLFGLAPFLTEQRTKEIDIHNVLGVSIAGLAGDPVRIARSCALTRIGIM